MNKLLSLAFLTLAAVSGLALQPAALTAQKALVYCPVDFDTSGCNTVVNALTTGGGFPGGVQKAYNGASGTLDLATADLSGYAVMVIPSLSDNRPRQPYDVLRKADVAARLSSIFIGRVAVWSGTPDQGAANRDLKNTLIRNLANYGLGDFAASGVPGLVVLQDQSVEGEKYGWLAGIAGRAIGADPTAKGFAKVRTLDAAGEQVVQNGSGKLAFDNMASYGLAIPEGSSFVAGAVGDESTTAFNSRTSTGTMGMSLIGVAEMVKTWWGAMFSTTNTVLATSSGNSSNLKPTMTLYGPGATGDPLPISVAPAGPIALRVTVDGGIICTVRPGSVDFQILTPASGKTAARVVASSTVSFAAGGSASANRSIEVSTSISPSPALEAGATYDVKAIYTSTGTATCKNSDASQTGALQAISKVTPSFTNLSSPTITYGTASAMLSGKVGSSSPYPSGNVSITLNGVTQTSAVSSTDGTFSSSFSTGSLNASETAYSISFSYPGDTNYNTATGSGSLTVSKASQTIIFTSTAPTSAVFGDLYTVTATGGASGNPVTFGASGACSMDSGKVKLTSTGSCTVTAEQAGNSNYDAAQQQSQSFSVGKAPTSLVASVNPSSVSYGGSVTLEATLTSGATSVTGKTVEFKIGSQIVGTATTSSPASVSVNLSTYPALGASTTPYTVTATFADDPNYADATDNSKTLTITKAAQSAVSVTGMPAGPLAFGATFTVGTTGGNAGAYSFASTGSCTVHATSGDAEINSGSGTCSITATRAGDDNYLSRTSDAATVAATLANQPSVAVTLPETATFPTGFTARASGGAAGATYSFSTSSTACSVNESTGVVTVNGTGACAITATATAANYNNASDTQSVTIGKGTATVTLGNLSQVYGAVTAVTATTSATGASSFTITYNGEATLPTAAGTYPVVATLVNDNFSGSASGNLVIAKAPATVELGNLSHNWDGTAKAATATTTPPDLTVTFTYTGVSGTTYPTSSAAPSGAGTYTVEATINHTNYQGSARGTLTINGWGFRGFFEPVVNRPTFNSLKAGMAVPLRFSLNGNRTLDIFSTAPTSRAVTCGTAPTDPVEEVVSAGSSSLIYNATTDTYQYTWKTDTKWAGTCRILELRFKDGTTETVNFTFTK